MQHYSLKKSAIWACLLCALCTTNAHAQIVYDKKLSNQTNFVHIQELEEKVRQMNGRLEVLEHNNIELLKQISDFKKQLNKTPHYNLVSEKEKATVLLNPTDRQKVSPVIATNKSPFKNTIDDGSYYNKKSEEKIDSPASAQDNYNAAFTLLRAKEYASAELAFKAFLELHPSHKLTQNAHYWLGETYYARGQYRTAALQFLQGYNYKKDGNKAPDNLLKLSISLAQINKKEDACTTLSKLKNDFDSISPAIKQRMQKELKQLSCK